jgi:hypothetical protein
MIADARHDSRISQHIEVAMVYKEMLGLDEARAYLEREHIPRDIVERILFTERRRRPQAPAPARSATPAAPFQCRRRNRVHDAIVEAALKIERKMGTMHAQALLKDEGVPDEVARRILAQGPRQLRARRPEGQ